MDEEHRSRLIRSFSHYSSSPGLELRYGVHGFVGDASVLRSAAYRIGILAALRSMKEKAVTGVMITSYGGSVEKNGVRIVDPDGGALIVDWENLADSVANVVDPYEFVTLIEECVKKENISFDGGQKAGVLLGRDTSPSGEALLEAAKQGISSITETIFHDMGILTSPQLHWLVHARNKGMKASEQDYFQQLSCSYRCLIELIPESSPADKISESLIVDGANGVGGDKLEALRDWCDGLEIEIRNTSKSGGMLNEGVGVDFIQEHKIVPLGFGSRDIGFRCASLDGDAERILYFSVLPNHKEIEIIDGNKILFLITSFMNEQLTELEELENEKEGHYDARLGILQRANESGASTNYLKSLGLDVVSFPTGTKSLHAEASKYDIGIYFEADGRGDILFSDDYLSWLEAKNNELSSCKGSKKQRAVSRLLAVSKLMNPTMSDALAGLLLVEGILQHNGWSVQKWNEIYCDLANRQLNADELVGRIAVTTENSETLAVGHSGTTEEADTLIDVSRPENAKDGSHLSGGQQVDDEAHTVEQIDVDAAVEFEESQEQGTIIAQAHETHTGLPEEFQERHDSQTVCLQSDEAADENKLDVSAEEEEYRDNCSEKRLADEISQRTHEFVDEQVVSPEPHGSESKDTRPAQVFDESEDPNKLDVSAAEEKSQDNTSEPSLAEEKTHEFVDEQVVSHESHIGDSEDSCPIQVLEEAEDRDKLDASAGEEESQDICSEKRLEEEITHEVISEQVVSLEPHTGVSDDSRPAHVLEEAENPDKLDASAVEEEAERVTSLQSHIGVYEDSCPAQVLEEAEDPDRVIDKGEIEIKKGEADDDAWVLVSDEKGDCSDAGPALTDTRDYKNLHELDEPSNEKESCSSPKVNGIHAPVANMDDSFVLADTEEAGGFSGTESAYDEQNPSQTSSGDRCPSVIVDDRNLEAKAQNGTVDVGNASNGLVNGTSLNAVEINSFSDGNGIRETNDSGEASPILSDVGTTEETGDINVLDYASSAVAPSQVNGVVVALPSSEHAAKVEANSENSHVEIDNGSTNLVNGKSSDTRISLSCTEVNGVEQPAVETLTNLPIPSDADNTEEVGATNDSEGKKPPSHIECSISSSFLDDNKLDSIAKNGGFDAEKGTDVNLPVDKPEEPSNPNDVVQDESSIAEGLGTAKHESKINGSISGLDIVQVAEPEVESENTLKEEIESVDKAEGPVKPRDVVQVAKSIGDGAGTAKHISEVNGSITGSDIAQVAEPETESENISKEQVESENGTAEVETSVVNGFESENISESTHDNKEVVSSPCLDKIAETEVTNGVESVPDIHLPSQTNGNSTAPYASAQNGAIEIQAESNPLEAEETDTVTVVDATTPQFKVKSHDAQEAYTGTPSNDEKRSDCLVGSVGLNTNIRFGSLEFVRNVCPKPEAPIIGSGDAGHDDASSDLGKAEDNIRVKEALDETICQPEVSDSHCENKVEGTISGGSSGSPHENSAISVIANTEGDLNEGNALNGVVHAVGSNVDEDSTSSLEGSATAVCDGESVGDEIVRKPFYYLIRIPKYDDEKLTEQIRSAEVQLEEKTRNRDVVLAEYRQQKDACQKLRVNQQTAILEERAARDLVRAKRKEIDSAQSLVNIAKDAMTIDDLDNKIANMEHTIQHETVPLSEEKKLIREIKQAKQQRDQLLAAAKKQGVQQALDQKDENEDRLKALRKELDALRDKLSEADHAVKAAVKRLDSEHAVLHELHRRLSVVNDVRQEAYSNLQNLKSQWSEKNKHVWSYRNAQRQANSYAISGDKTSLQSVCVNQVESVMKLWNLDDDFRRGYVKSNLRSTLRRLGTPDGRSLGPDEEPPLLAMPPIRRINEPVKDIKEPRVVVVAHREPVTELRKADTKSSANKVVEHKKVASVNNKPNKDSSIKNEETQASNTVKVEEDKEELKARKEQEELARKAEELRKEEEAVRLKEIRRAEEKVKFQEALERKKKQAQKAQAKAELKAKREAEEKEKEKEKRARKKGNKREDTTSIPDNEAATNPEAQTEQPKELETREKTVTIIKRAQKPQYAKQNKLKTILPAPLPLRNRGRRRTQQWVWLAVTIVAVLALFFLGNLNLPDEITSIFSSWH